MEVIDSNVLIAAFRAEEHLHEDALEILGKNGELILLDYVLSEVGTVLLYKEGRQVMRKVLEFLTNNENIRIERLSTDELRIAIDLFAAQAGKLSFVGVALAVFSKKRGFSLCSFDADLVKFVGKMP